MRTIRTKVYQFSELATKEARQKAIEWYRRGMNEDGDALYFFSEHCSEWAAEQGFNDIELRYSLSCCQGDGLSFTCKDFDIDKFVSENIPSNKKLLQKVLAANLTYSIKANNGHYAYASKGDIDLTLDANKDYPNIELIVDELRETLEDKYMALCKEFENTGYRWIDDANTDESIIENIEANEYEFKADGTRF